MDITLILGLIVISLIAGLIGSLFGLGGGIIVVPALTILYKMDGVDAVAVSLVAIVAISSASASSLVRKRISNVRIGLRLEIAAAVGAAAGAVIAIYIIRPWVLSVCFAAIMIYSAAYMLLRPERPVPAGPSGTDDFVYHDARIGEDVHYNVKNTGTGMLGFAVAGMTSALTGLGGGMIKIPIMNVHMRMPVKAATATSSYVIGITAFSGAAVYLLSGVLDIQTASFVMIGAFAGSMIGLRILPKIDASSLRRYFAVLLVFLAAVMLMNVGGLL